jgi:peptide deformylase
MIVKHITQIGNPVIREKSKPVLKISSPTVKRIIKNLVDSMRYHGLLGMAAPQIGINLRIFVTEIRKTRTTKKARSRKYDQVRVFINPNIMSRSRKQVLGYEGCGSVANAGIFGEIKRSYSITVKAQDSKGKKFLLKASDLLARVIQHEYDHLEGKVFLDHSPHKKSLMSREEYLKR